MGTVLNLTQYMKQAYTKKAMFIYHGTAALKKGFGMCYDLDYANSSITGEKVTDSFGARGLKEIQIPSSSNNMAFAGVLTQNYAANPNGLVRKVELALPGGCAMIAQAATSVINTGLLTCAVGEDDSGDTTLINGIFGYGGFRGKGSAIPLTTLAVADEGDMPMQEITGVSTAVYASSTDITTITSSTGTPGAYMGWESGDLDVNDYEFVVWGGAHTDSTTERCPSGVYPVLQATASTVFTVKGDTGDGLLTGTLRKKGLLKLAYLCDGDESGLVDYFLPETGAATEAILTEGMSIVIGGISVASDVDAVVADSNIDGARKGFYMLGTLGTAQLKLNITSGYTLSGTAIAGGTLSTVEFETAGEWVTLQWHQFGPAGTSYGIWMADALSGGDVVLA